MEQGGFIPWEEWENFKPRQLCCPCCMGVRILPDGEELEQFVNDQIDRERVADAILKLEIETLKKAVEKVENISGIRKGKSERTGT